MATCETCNDTHSMSLRGSLVPCTRCPTPCQECRINGRGAYCATTPCACACHSIVDRPALTPAPGLDLDAAEKRAAGFRGAFRAMSYDSGDEMLEFVSDGADPTRDDDEIAQFACDDETQRAIVATLNDAPALIAEVRALRAKLAEAKRLGMEACALVHSAIDNAPDPTSNDPGDQSAIAAGHSVADRIAAALEAL